jgi:glycosyltransferase involved in cell wall biosynthesis
MQRERDNTGDLAPVHPAPAAVVHIDAHRRATFTILHVGELAGIDLVVDAFTAAREHDPRLHLVLVGTGPDEAWLRLRLGPAATFVANPEPSQLAELYAGAGLLVSATPARVSRDAVLAAQACGLPVLAVDTGDYAELIESGRSGCLVPPDARLMAAALHQLARRDVLRQRLARGGLWAASAREGRATAA